MRYACVLSISTSPTVLSYDPVTNSRPVDEKSISILEGTMGTPQADKGSQVTLNNQRSIRRTVRETLLQKVGMLLALV